MAENVQDVFTAMKVKVVAEVTTSIFSFTRADVLVKLMEFAAAAANTLGPYSEEVVALESDIEAVKGGAALVDFTWCFPQMDDFEKAED